MNYTSSEYQEKGGGLPLETRNWASHYSHVARRASILSACED